MVGYLRHGSTLAPKVEKKAEDRGGVHSNRGAFSMCEDDVVGGVEKRGRHGRSGARRAQACPIIDLAAETGTALPGALDAARLRLSAQWKSLPRSQHHHQTSTSTAHEINTMSVGNPHMILPVTPRNCPLWQQDLWIPTRLRYPDRIARFRSAACTYLHEECLMHEWH